MKVLHVSPSFYPATHYGGTVASGYGLCNALAQLPGVQLRVLTTDCDGPGRIPLQQNPVQLPAGYEVHYCRRWFGRDLAPELLLKLNSMIRWADVVHLTAVYSTPTFPTLMLARWLQRPVVWSVRGALQRWEGSTRPRAKQWWEAISNSLCDRERVLLHVTSEDEKRESTVRIPNARAVIIPNGIDIPVTTTAPKQAANQLRLLYLGRLHPIKGIENLIVAMKLVQQGATLAICGSGEAGYEEKLRSLVLEHGLDQAVEFVGHVDGPVREQQFLEADICIVPSHKENFCMVVAESLAHAVPVIASQGTPWSRLEELGCGLWVSNEPEQLARAVDHMRTRPLTEMGNRGRDWMTREFSWQMIGERVLDQYQLLLKEQILARKGEHQRQAA